MKFNSRKDGICESPTLGISKSISFVFLSLISFFFCLSVKSSSCVSGNFYTMVELNPLNNDSRDVESAVSISIDTGNVE
jgi:hypothetical protein